MLLLLLIWLLGLSSYEVFEGQKVVANYGRLTSVHTRYHLLSETPTEAPIAFDEMFTNAMLLGRPITHSTQQ